MLKPLSLNVLSVCKKLYYAFKMSDDCCKSYILDAVTNNQVNLSVSINLMDIKQNFNYILEGCRTGGVISVVACLSQTGKDAQELLCRQHITSDGEVYTPFLIAVRNGHTQLVRVLLEQFQIKQSQHCGTLNFDGYLIEGATPLWCASANGYLEIVRLLIADGADINQATTTNSTPLRAACFQGSLPVVEYLMDSGADPTISNRYNNTCLMVSAYRGNIEVVDFLLNKKVDSNVQAKCGGTALHLACESGNLLIVESLVQAGCDVTITNKAGMTAAMVAADACKSEIIEFFIKQPTISQLEKVTLLELLGASYANDKDNYNTDKTYHYLLLGLLMRSNDKLPKCTLPPVEAYNGRVECEKKQDIEAIRYDQDAIHIEALIVRERILGLNSIEVIHPIVYRGAVYADGLQFNRCIKLWKRALHLRQLNNKSSHNDLLRFAEVFSQMILLKEKINVNDLCDITQRCIDEIALSRTEVDKHRATVQRLADESGEKMEVDFPHTTISHDACPVCEEAQSSLGAQANLVAAIKRLDTNLCTLLYLIYISCCLENDKHKFATIIYRFLKLDVRSSDGSSLIHMACSEKTPVDDFHVKDVCSFPDYNVTKFLLTCGADPNATNKNGDTPLHVIVQYDKPISDFLTLHQIITSLLEHGAHFDVCNKQRKSPLQLSTTGVAEIILKTQSHVTLQCLAARALRHHNIPYADYVSGHIKKFVDMH